MPRCFFPRKLDEEIDTAKRYSVCQINILGESPGLGPLFCVIPPLSPSLYTVKQGQRSVYLVGSVGDGHQHLLQSRLQSAADAHQTLLVLQLSPRPQQQAFHHLLRHLQTFVSLGITGPHGHIASRCPALLATLCRGTASRNTSP